MFLNIVSLLLCGLFIVPSIYSEGTTYILDPFTIQTLEIDEKNCTKPGKMCDSCTNVSYCVELADGTWIKEELYSCSDGSTCLESIGECVNEPNPSCDANVVDYKFVCYELGTFPDPFDCTKYHMCIPSAEGSSKPLQDSISFKCTNGYSYDPLSTLCRNKLVNGTCERFAPVCNTTGQSGGIAGHPNMYYICLKNDANTASFPQMFLCPHDQEFNGEKCEDMTPPSGVDAEGKCTTKGYFVDSVSCKNYLDCTSAGVMPTRRNCDAGKKFDHKTQTCVLFEC